MEEENNKQNETPPVEPIIDNLFENQKLLKYEDKVVQRFSTAENKEGT